MGFLVSPGVNITETDLTNIIPAVAVTDGGLVGQFKWGPVKEVKLIESEKVLEKTFGRPTDSTFVSFLTAASFLAYSSSLRLVRVVDEASAKNAVATGSSLLIKNKDHYDSLSLGSNLWAAKYPGEYGNSLKISFCPSAKAFSQSLTGTIDVAEGATSVVGTGSAFTSELAVGSYLYNAAKTEKRKITAVASNTSATIESAFSAAIDDATLVADWEYADYIGIAPSTSAYAENRNSVNDECHIVIVDEDGVFTGSMGQVLETFAFVSLASDAKKQDGSSNYYKEVINNVSKYVYFISKESAGTTWNTAAANTTYTEVKKPYTYSFTGGNDGSAAANAAKMQGYDLFKSTENYDIGLIMGGDADATLASYIIQNVAEHRKDAVAFVSPARADVVSTVDVDTANSNVIAFRNNLPSSSYGVMDNGWKKMYDKYNDVDRWVPLNGDIAGLCARTDHEKDPWWSPAGLNRGQIKNVVRTAYTAELSHRNDLYLKGINSVVRFPGLGTVLWGDKTLLAKPSAFDRINVRRLFIVLEKAIATAAKFMLFEFNDVYTRAQFRNMVEPYLREVQGRRGIYDFKVVCDETNNTGEVIDQNMFVADIFIKPAKSINFIQLNFVATRTDAEFNEILNIV